MKSTGIVRHIDELGRIVIPKEMRKCMHIADNDPVEIFVEEDRIILKKKNECCHFCGTGEQTQLFKGKLICAKCIDELKK